MERQQIRREDAVKVAPVRVATPPRPVARWQPKLTVGAAHDPLEAEAERVADRVMRMLRTSSMPAQVPASAGDDGSDASGVARIRRHAGHDHDDHDHGGAGPEVGLAGGPISAELSTRIASASGGAALDDRTRARMEHGFGASFDGVRIHANSVLPRQIAADAFTSGNHVHFAPGLYRPGSSSGQHLLAHELTHVVQQGGAVARRIRDVTHGHDQDVSRSIAEDITPADLGGAVRRHSSWEHMMIGDLDPKSLATLGAQKNVRLTPNTPVDVGNDVNGQPITVTAADIKHVIQQEIQRLQYFQATPPMVTSYGEIGQREQQLKQQDSQDTHDRVLADTGNANAALLAQQQAQWDLKLVGVPNRSGHVFLVTYGEMNTLGDYFGSIEEMEAVDHKWIGKLIRGIRESALRELVTIYAKVSGFTIGLDGTAAHQARAELGVDSEKFRSAHGKDDAIALGGVTNELKLMGAIPVPGLGSPKPLVGGDATTDYSSTLARNACHFAPESWHAWAGYHEKARAYAKQAYDENQWADTLDHNGQADMAARRRELAAELRNRAMLNNGFGDHYLQDSYAAGHLINKTRIMQQYVQWLDQHPGKWDAHKDKNWRKVQQIAYNQPGLTDDSQYDKANVGVTRQSSSGVTLESARNPQTSENVQGTWKDKAEALGLQVPASIGNVDAKRLLVHWQTKCVTRNRLRTPRVQTWKTVRAWGASLGLNQAATGAALQLLFQDGIVRKDDYSTSDWTPGRSHQIKPGTKLTLRDEYVPSNQAKLTRVTTGPGADAAFSDMTLGVAYNDYLEFMNSSFLQKATNFIHNEFCERGLDVSTGDQAPVFTVYGDDNMFNRDAGKGLLHSGETAHMSRDAILSIADTGASAVSKNDILNRLPAFVRVAGNNAPLERWGDDLGGEMDTLFEKMSDIDEAFVNKTVVGVKGSLGKITNSRPSGHQVF